MSEDNWQHRAANMRCRTCMYFVEKTAMTGVVVTPDGQAVQAQKLGRCRRHAPPMSGWPVVFPDDWCGDHKLDESKLPLVPIEIRVDVKSGPSYMKLEPPICDTAWNGA